MTVENWLPGLFRKAGGCALKSVDAGESKLTASNNPRGVRAERDFRSRRSILALGVALSVPVLMARRSEAQSVQYTYDALGRLKTATYPNGHVVTYSYDAAGNRSQVTSGSPSAPPPPPPPPPPAITVSVSPGTVYGDAYSPSSAAAVSVAGGVSPFTYAWERVSGSALVVVDAPSSATTTWSYPGGDIPPDKIAYWRCKVTDAANQVVYTGSVKVQMVMTCEFRCG